MGQAGQDKVLAHELLEALRARLALVAEADPAEVTSRTTIRETLAFVRLMYRQARVVWKVGSASAPLSRPHGEVQHVQDLVLGIINPRNVV